MINTTRFKFKKILLYHILVWLSFFVISWSFFESWLGLNHLYHSHFKIFTFSFVYVLSFSPLPYLFLYLINKSKTSFFIYSLIALVLLLACLYFSFLDYVFLLPYRPDWIFSFQHFVSRIPYILILTLIVRWLFIQEMYHQQKKYFEDYLQKDKENTRLSSEASISTTDIFLSIKYNGKQENIDFDSILYIEGAKQYIKIITKNKTYLHLESRLTNSFKLVILSTFFYFKI